MWKKCRGLLRVCCFTRIRKPMSLLDTWVVSSGDTLSGIGEATNVPWRQIATLNSIKKPYMIFPDQIVLLPVVETEGVVEGKSFTENVVAEPGMTYRQCKFTGGGLILEDVSDVTVEDNQFIDPTWSGIRLNAGVNERIRIVGNRFIGGTHKGGHGAVMLDGSTTNRFVWIEDNHMEVGGIGIGLDAGEHIWVTDNYYHGSAGGEGVACSASRVKISGNECHGAGGAGVLVYYVPATGRIRITGNDLYDNAQGIALVWSTNDSTIQDTLITENQCYGDQSYGIQSYPSAGVIDFDYENVRISDNQFEGTAGQWNLLNPNHPGLKVTL